MVSFSLLFLLIFILSFFADFTGASNDPISAGVGIDVGIDGHTTNVGDDTNIGTQTLGGSYTLLSTLPHDPTSFTQGLMTSPYDKDNVYESAGLYGRSNLRLVSIATGEVIRSTTIGAKYFAEGIHVNKDLNRIYMLTWKERTGVVFNAETLQILHDEQFSYATHTGEGWGITGDGNGTLYVSDGSAWILQWDEVTMSEVRRFKVKTSKGHGIRFLNELEWYKGTIIANVWYSDVIVRIDPKTGTATHIHDLKNLYPKGERNKDADCLNGIAVLEGGEEIMVTGKNWDKAFRIKLDPP